MPNATAPGAGGGTETNQPPSKSTVADERGAQAAGQPGEQRQWQVVDRGRGREREARVDRERSPGTAERMAEHADDRAGEAVAGAERERPTVGARHPVEVHHV